MPVITLALAIALDRLQGARCSTPSVQILCYVPHQLKRFGAVDDGEHQIPFAAGKAISTALGRGLDCCISAMDVSGEEEGQGGILQIQADGLVGSL
ncbi:hypothetical protein D9M70_388700 [compost metagenome]